MGFFFLNRIPQNKRDSRRQMLCTFAICLLGILVQGISAHDCTGKLDNFEVACPTPMGEDHVYTSCEEILTDWPFFCIEEKNPKKWVFYDEKDKHKPVEERVPICSEHSWELCRDECNDEALFSEEDRKCHDWPVRLSVGNGAEVMCGQAPAHAGYCESAQLRPYCCKSCGEPRPGDPPVIAEGDGKTGTGTGSGNNGGGGGGGGGSGGGGNGGGGGNSGGGGNGDGNNKGGGKNGGGGKNEGSGGKKSKDGGKDKKDKNPPKEKNPPKDKEPPPEKVEEPEVCGEEKPLEPPVEVQGRTLVLCKQLVNQFPFFCTQAIYSGDPSGRCCMKCKDVDTSCVDNPHSTFGQTSDRQFCEAWVRTDPCRCKFRTAQGARTAKECCGTCADYESKNANCACRDSLGIAGAKLEIKGQPAYTSCVKMLLRPSNHYLCDKFQLRKEWGDCCKSCNCIHKYSDLNKCFDRGLGKYKQAGVEKSAPCHEVPRPFLITQVCQNPDTRQQCCSTCLPFYSRTDSKLANEQKQRWSNIQQCIKSRD